MLLLLPISTALSCRHFIVLSSVGLEPPFKANAAVSKLSEVDRILVGGNRPAPIHLTGSPKPAGPITRGRKGALSGEVGDLCVHAGASSKQSSAYNKGITDIQVSVFLLRS